MARLLDDALSQYLEVASTPVTAVPFSMGCWFNSDSIADTQFLMQVYDRNNDGNYFSISAAGNVGGDPIRVYTWNTPTSGFADSTSGYSASTWHHALGVYVATDDRIAYLDGGSKGTDNTAVTPSASTRVLSGASYWGGYGNYLSGLVAEAAIWNAALTDAEAAILAAGYSPLLVRPQSLVAYWPFIRDTDDDIVGVHNFTAVNNPTIGAHTRVFYPGISTPTRSGICTVTVTVTATATVTTTALE